MKHDNQSFVWSYKEDRCWVPKRNVICAPWPWSWILSNFLVWTERVTDQFNVMRRSKYHSDFHRSVYLFKKLTSPLVPGALFLYPLKHHKTRFNVFRWYKKGTWGTNVLNWAKDSFLWHWLYLLISIYIIDIQGFLNIIMKWQWQQTPSCKYVCVFLGEGVLKTLLEEDIFYWEEGLDQGRFSPFDPLAMLKTIFWKH